MDATNKHVDLGTMFSYLQDIAESLEKVTRWDLRSKIGGQTAAENDLQHSFKTALFTLYCAIVENEQRAANEKLNVELLVVMALIHDIAEIKVGDIASFKRTKGDREPEYRAFCEIIAPLPEPVRNYIGHAFCHAFPGVEQSIESRESRFFKVVEMLGFLKRGIHECRAGNVHFAPKNFDRDVPKLLAAAEEFPSIHGHIQPFLAEMMSHLDAFNRSHSEYRDAFVQAGNDADDFPF
ncbi:MAG: HD domain-containing protein [Candidatus Niyogibacteria bacterium]|nr:HD domain-containing protein [Candidatus Niyogibacteria bacterium]